MYAESVLEGSEIRRQSVCEAHLQLPSAIEGGCTLVGEDVGFFGATTLGATRSRGVIHSDITFHATSAAKFCIDEIGNFRLKIAFLDWTVVWQFRMSVCLVDCRAAAI